LGTSTPGANLLGDINALLGRFKLGDQLGHMSAGSLRLKSTFFLRGILNNGLGSFRASLFTLKYRI